jgi:hypothetical protein
MVVAWSAEKAAYGKFQQKDTASIIANWCCVAAIFGTRQRVLLNKCHQLLGCSAIALGRRVYICTPPCHI